MKIGQSKLRKIRWFIIVLVCMAGLFAIVGSGTAPTQPVTKLPPRMLPGKTFCNNGICEHEQTYRTSEDSDGYIDEKTTYQIFCDKQMYKVIESYYLLVLRNYPDKSQVRGQKVSDAEMLIRPDTYIYDVYMENCKPK